MQHLETCLLTAETDRVLYNLVIVLTVFFPWDVQNEIELLARFVSYSWLVCLLVVWLRNAPLVKVFGNPISDGSLFSFALA